jgi:hypothetical protein
MLIDNRADINATDEREITPQYRACSTAQTSVARMLIYSDAGVKASDRKGKTLLH